MLNKICRGRHFFLFAFMLLVTLAACDNGTTTTEVVSYGGPVPAELRGTWIGTGTQANQLFIITADLIIMVKYTLPDGSVIAGGLSFTPENNTGTTATAYPQGYRSTGIVITGSGTFETAYGMGYGSAMYLNAAKDKMVIGTELDPYEKH